jgi:hypothetical protein
MKKASKYFNEIMLIALIAFIPMTMLSCSVDEVQCADIPSGRYYDDMNPNIIWEFYSDGRLTIEQDGQSLFDNYYVQSQYICELERIIPNSYDTIRYYLEVGEDYIKLTTFYTQTILHKL